MKKSKFFGLIFGFLAVLSLGVFSGCSVLENEGGGSLQDETFVTNVSIDSNQDVYSFGAFSTLSLLSSSSMDTLSLSEVTTEEPTTEEETTTEEVDDDEEIDLVNQYINMFEGLLSSDTSMFESVYEESDLEGYDNKLTVNITNINGEVSTFVLYFNEFVVDEEVEIDEDEDLLVNVPEQARTRVQFRAQESIATQEEVEIQMEGIMIMNEVQYELRGKKEIEEDEVEFKFLAKIDDQNYVKVKQEKEGQEEEYKYVIVQNGEVVSESSVEIKKENGELRLEVEINENGLQRSYEFEKEEKDGETYIKMEFENNGEERELKVRVREGQNGEKYYEYENEEGQKHQRERNNLDDDDEESDL